MPFVLPDETFNAVSGDEVVYQPRHADRNAYAVSGDFEAWKDGVAALAIGNSRLAFAMAAGFAGPHLRLQDTEGGGFHYRGSSSTGKTTALAIAGSIWGGGGQNGFTKRWRTTDNALEGIALEHCDTLLTLDEMSEGDPKAVSKGVYMLANGQGKGRMSAEATLKPVQEWRVLFLSTGEVGLADKIAEDGGKSTAGQEIRIVDIPADAGAGMGIFEQLHGRAQPSQLADEIKAASARHYGHASREYLKRLAADMDGATKRAKALISDFVASTCPKNADGQVKRACKRFALVAAACTLATDWGILPWPADEADKAARRLFKVWLDARGSDAPLEITNALSQARQLIDAHGASRFQIWDGVKNVSGGQVVNQLGVIKRGADGNCYYVFPDAFKKEFCKGLDTAVMIKALRKIGALDADKDKAQKTQRIPNFGRRKYYVIDAEKLFNAEDCDAASANEVLS